VQRYTFNFFEQIFLSKNIFQKIIVYYKKCIYFGKFKTMQKVKFELEVPVNSSPQLLYQYISTPSGLQEWFAEEVNSRGEFFTFVWDDSEENARLASKKAGERVRFKWIDEDKNDTEYYFEIKILEDEITKDVSLMVTDYAYEDEVDEAKQLWENQISDLKHIIGSI